MVQLCVDGVTEGNDKLKQKTLARVSHKVANFMESVPMDVAWSRTSKCTTSTTNKKGSEQLA